MSEERRNKIHHPYVTSGVIVSIVGLFVSGIGSFNTLETHAEINASDIAHERELRISQNNNVKEKLDELKQDSKDLKKDLKESTDEIKNLINELLLRESE